MKRRSNKLEIKQKTKTKYSFIIPSQSSLISKIEIIAGNRKQELHTFKRDGEKKLTIIIGQEFFMDTFKKYNK